MSTGVGQRETTGPLSHNAEADKKRTSSQGEVEVSVRSGDSQKGLGESLTFENQAFMADLGDNVAESNSAMSVERLTTDDVSADRLTNDVSSFFFFTLDLLNR